MRIWAYMHYAITIIVMMIIIGDAVRRQPLPRHPLQPVLGTAIIIVTVV